MNIAFQDVPQERVFIEDLDLILVLSREIEIGGDLYYCYRILKILDLFIIGLCKQSSCFCFANGFDYCEI